MGTRHERGFTVVEMLMVLAIASLLVVAGWRSYDTIVSLNQLKQFAVQRDEVFVALQEYFWQNCKNSASNPQPTISGLVASGIVSDSGVFVDPIGQGTFFPAVDWAEPTRLRVNLSFSSRGGALRWADPMKADLVSGSNLVWIRPAGEISDDLISMRTQMNGMYEGSSACNQYFGVEGT